MRVPSVGAASFATVRLLRFHFRKRAGATIERPYLRLMRPFDFSKLAVGALFPGYRYPSHAQQQPTAGVPAANAAHFGFRLYRWTESFGSLLLAANVGVSKLVQSWFPSALQTVAP